MRTLIFAGTTEGRRLFWLLRRRGMDVAASVATDYGKETMESADGVVAGRLDRGGMEKLMAEYDTVVDATHPYAADVTQNIKAACEATGTRYIRLLRRGSGENGCTIEEAVRRLNGTRGRILSTLGSKELKKLTEIENYGERVVVRILPMEENLAAARRLGFTDIICMKGPFSREMNAATLRDYGCSFLLTKDSGEEGGFSAKTEAARDAGAEAIIIGRPRETGECFSFDEVVEMLGCHKEKPGHFPVFADVKGKRALIVGGGKIAARRARTLSLFDMTVDVVAKEASADIESLGVNIAERPFCDKDIDGAFIVVAATDDRALNRHIGEAARSRGMFVSVADAQSEGNFFFPAVATDGSTVVGIIGDGSDHGAVKRTAAEIRRIVER